MPICRDCRWYRRGEPDPDGLDSDYLHRCGLPARQWLIDYVTGEERAAFALCRDFNGLGQCNEWEGREDG